MFLLPRKLHGWLLMSVAPAVGVERAIMESQLGRLSAGNAEPSQPSRGCALTGSGQAVAVPHVNAVNFRLQIQMPRVPRFAHSWKVRVDVKNTTKLCPHGCSESLALQGMTPPECHVPLPLGLWAGVCFVRRCWSASGGLCAGPERPVGSPDSGPSPQALCPPARGAGWAGTRHFIPPTLVTRVQAG